MTSSVYFAGDTIPLSGVERTNTPPMMTHRNPDTAMSIHLLAAIASAAVSLIFAMHYYFVPLFLQGGSGGTSLALGAWRGVVGGGILLVATRPVLKWFIAESNWARILILAVLGGSVNQILLFEGLKSADPVVVGVLANSLPILMSGVGLYLGLEFFSWRRLLGIALGFSAVTLAIFFGGNTPTGGGHFVSSLLVFLSFLSLAIALCLAKKWFPNERPTLVAGGMVFIGGLILAAPSFDQILTVWGRGVSSLGLFGIFVFEICISTAVAYSLNVYGIQKLGVERAGWFSYLQPIFAAIIGAAFFARPVNMVFFPILIVVCSSGLLVLRSRDRPTQFSPHD